MCCPILLDYCYHLYLTSQFQNDWNVLVIHHIKHHCWIAAPTILFCVDHTYYVPWTITRSPNFAIYVGLCAHHNNPIHQFSPNRIWDRNCHMTFPQQPCMWPKKGLWLCLKWQSPLNHVFPLGRTMRHFFCVFKDARVVEVHELYPFGDHHSCLNNVAGCCANLVPSAIGSLEPSFPT